MSPHQDTNRSICTDQTPFDQVAEEDPSNACAEFPYHEEFTSGDMVIMIICLSVLGWFLGDWIAAIVRSLI